MNKPGKVVAKTQDYAVLKVGDTKSFFTDVEYELWSIKGKTIISGNRLSDWKSGNKLLKRLREENHEILDKFEEHYNGGEQ